MHTSAVILEGPRALTLGELALRDPKDGEIVVETRHSGISTGTEALFWSGRMPPFPGMGYPLVPGYEAAGRVLEAPASSGFRAGDAVFVPGADCYEGARGLFGGAAGRIVTDAARAVRIDAAMGPQGALLALAATARHAIAAPGGACPDLIVGHGVLGRLLARLAVAAGAPPPTVWEREPVRQDGAAGYEVTHPDLDTRRDYASIYDASGDSALLNALIGRAAKGAEIVLAGFYPGDVSFAFAPAFMREVRLRVAAEWGPADMAATRALIECGALSLSGLVTHARPASDAPEAYRTAFEDPACLKMILDWSAA